MIPCEICGQPARWKAYHDNIALDRFRCSCCKPAPWTAGFPARSGIYYRPLEVGDEEAKTGDFEPMSEEEGEDYGSDADPQGG